MEALFAVAVLAVLIALVLRRATRSTPKVAKDDQGVDRLKSQTAQFLSGAGKSPSREQELFVERLTRQSGLAPSSDAGARRLRHLEEILKAAGHERASAKILEALGDEDPGVCYWAARWAGEHQVRDAVSGLIELLGRPESEFMYVRKAAARSLATLKSEVALGPLEKAHRGEKVPGVREAIGEAIAALRGRSRT